MNGNQRHLLRNRQQKQVKKTDTTETAESSQPEVHVSPTEEENPDEGETLGTIEPIIPENQV